MLVQIPLDRAVPLENGEYYLYQVIGLGVETDKGEALGRVIDVIETGANDVFVVQGASGELLIPAIGDVVQHLDLEARRLVVRLIPGLRADNT
jgi:16S rRNA processing protein RimM